MMNMMAMSMNMMQSTPTRPSNPMNRPTRNPSDTPAPTVTAEPTPGPTASIESSAPDVTPAPTSSTNSPTSVNPLTTVTGEGAEHEELEGHPVDQLSDAPSDVPSAVPTLASALQQHQILIH